MRRRLRSAVVLWAALNAGIVLAQEFEYSPGTNYDPAVPTLNSVVGHGWGEEVSSYAEIERYLTALSDFSPMVEMRSYGRTWEGRELHYLVISSAANLARVDDFRASIRALADPRTGATPSTDTLPVVVWLIYGVHGNEISSPNAALLTAYHLAAARGNPLVDSVLENCVVLIDAQQNPDGRDRFVNYFRQTRGRWPDADPAAAEHNEAWPGGRTNHYAFDLNRDWFARTQIESRARVDVFMDWYPQVVVDLHEMGGNSTYYFAPPADPLNPGLTSQQVEWLRRFGRNNAVWFDRLRIDYFTREVFDSFYPGYGEGWPMFHGAIGMTYEQASVRGLVFEREDQTRLHFRESVRNHFVASIATLETAAGNRSQLLEDFGAYRREAIVEGGQGGIREFLLPPGPDPGRTAALVANLMAQGIEVKVAAGAFRNNRVVAPARTAAESRDFPAGTYLVLLAQPAGRLAKTLLETHVPMPEDFVQRQKDRRAKQLRDEIYDVTAWSLPLIYDVECFGAEAASEVAATRLLEKPGMAGEIRGGAAELAYLVPWGTHASGRLLAALMNRKLRVHVSDEAFSLAGLEFPPGSLIIKVRENPGDLYRQLQELVGQTGAVVYPTNSGWVDSGINLGSDHVRFLRPPRIAMAYGLPVRSSSVGATRYLLEQAYGYPVTVIHTYDLARADLSRYNVLILPDASGMLGGYSGFLGERGVQRLKEWVAAGGTLVAIGSAAEWLTGEKVGLLASRQEKKQAAAKEPSEQKDEGAATKGDDKPPAGGDPYEELIRPDEESPDTVPGALVRVRIADHHWLGFGYDGDTFALVNSNRVLTPLKVNQGTNVGVYFPEPQLLVSGFAWEGSMAQLANKAFLMHQGHGRGHVVAFAEDPNFRAYLHGLDVLFLNAVFFGPAH